ncbi:MAG: phosphatase PAP2 family protein [Desulfovibrionaceae bacterium]|nr:phosphatase PAP2 family protein [Desulfovibrionaceae bacterium]
MLKIVLSLLLVLLSQVTVYAKEPLKNELNSPFSSEEELIDSQALIPPYPDFSSILFLEDKARYEQGLAIRKTERGMQATKEADNNYFPEVFFEPFGLAITQENTPHIWALVKRVRRELSTTNKKVKNHYKRIRPFVLYNHPTCYPADDEELRTTYSYPSNHSMRAFGTALVLSEINPKRKELILKAAIEYGQSRVICGCHWQSDVDQARVLAAAVVANLHSNAEFQKYLKLAKEEFAKLVD